ncbi:MAG: pyridoxamine 5-phosphate oxidase-related, FMN-binding protein [Cyanobacteria bacterium RYN_339]|nr:pyridoxamine 5-phosphate oxidase-related, FMN-binding protein [Cyanobacteria bacterium RYN_339]
MTERIDLARELLLTWRHGVLATLSLDLPGYPFGSITPYALDHAGEPLILISTIAQHTKNIQADPRVSLTIHDPHDGDPQAAPRLTWVADASPVAPEDAAANARYLAYFPDSAGYSDTHDFALYRLQLKRARFIGGFGRIYWLEREELVVPNPFALTETGIVTHMNEDHGHNLRAYCKAFKDLDASEAVMQGLDAHGFDVLADGKPLRFGFERAIATPDEARQELVRLAKVAREKAFAP